MRRNILTIETRDSRTVDISVSNCPYAPTKQELLEILRLALEEVTKAADQVADEAIEEELAAQDDIQVHDLVEEHKQHKQRKHLLHTE